MANNDNVKVNPLWKYAAVGSLSIAATLLTTWVSFGRTAVTHAEVQAMVTDKLAHPSAVVEALTKKYQGDLKSINERLRNIELQQTQNSTKLEILMDRVPPYEHKD